MKNLMDDFKLKRACSCSQGELKLVFDCQKCNDKISPKDEPTIKELKVGIKRLEKVYEWQLKAGLAKEAEAISKKIEHLRMKVFAMSTSN